MRPRELMLFNTSYAQAESELSRRGLSDEFGKPIRDFVSLLEVFNAGDDVAASNAAKHIGELVHREAGPTFIDALERRSHLPRPKRSQS